ncbi:MAG: Rrf2 family transcriptional regulator, partial [Anaerolineales bacterium]
LAEVVLALEGPLAPTSCVQVDVVDDCPFGERCAVRGVWLRVTDATQHILEQTSFADLAADEIKRAQAQRA